MPSDAARGTAREPDSDGAAASDATGDEADDARTGAVDGDGDDAAPAAATPTGVELTTDAPARALLTDERLVSILMLSGVGVVGPQAVPPALPAIQSTLAVPDAQIGLVMTALFLPAMVLTPVTGAICDIYGRRPVSLASLALFGAAGVAIFAAPTFEVVLALRVIQGISFAALTPLSVAFIGDFFAGTAGTTAQGIRVSTNGLVIIVAPAIAGALADVAWNYPFLLYGAAFPALVYVYYNFPEATAFDDDAERSVTGEFGAYVRGMLSALNDRNLLLLILGGFTLFLVKFGMMTIVPLLATRAVGLRPATVGLLFSLIGLVRVVVSPQAGRVAGWLPRKTGFVVTMGIVAASMALFAVATSLAGLVAAVVVYALGMSVFNPTLNDTVTATAPPDNRAGVVSALQASKNSANTVGPAAASLLFAATDFRTVFLAGGVVAVGYVALVVVGLDPEAY
ncbi:MAG: MFS transporter [Haloferacaceae archaeon]